MLRRAEDLLPDSPDLRHLTRVRARRARWLRLAGRPDEASAGREETEKGLEPGELSPEHIVWLVESALAAGTDAERATWEERLDELSRHTGVCVPPWERALLARS